MASIGGKRIHPEGSFHILLNKTAARAEKMGAFPNSFEGSSTYPLRGWAGILEFLRVDKDARGKQIL